MDRNQHNILVLACAKWGIETLVSCYHITQENYKLNFQSDDSQKRKYIFEVETPQHH